MPLYGALYSTLYGALYGALHVLSLSLQRVNHYMAP